MCCSPTWVQRPLCSARTHPALLFFHSFYKSVVNTLFCRTDDACARRVASLVPLNKKMAAAAEATLCCEREKERETDKRKRERERKRSQPAKSIFFYTREKKERPCWFFFSALSLSFPGRHRSQQIWSCSCCCPCFLRSKKNFWELSSRSTSDAEWKEIFYFLFLFSPLSQFSSNLCWSNLSSFVLSDNLTLSAPDRFIACFRFTGSSPFIVADATLGWSCKSRLVDAAARAVVIFSPIH